MDAVREAEERLAEHIMSTDSLDLSIRYAVTFARANMLAQEMADSWNKEIRTRWWYK